MLDCPTLFTVNTTGTELDGDNSLRSNHRNVNFTTTDGHVFYIPVLITILCWTTDKSAQCICLYMFFIFTISFSTTLSFSFNTTIEMNKQTHEMLKLVCKKWKSTTKIVHASMGRHIAIHIEGVLWIDTI